MKKQISILISAFLIIGILLTACQKQPTATIAPAPVATATTALAVKPILVVSLPALDNPLMLAFQDAFKGTFGDEFDVQVSSADGNANTQATQIENYTAMKPDFMFVMAVEPTSLVPKLIAARDAGAQSPVCWW